MYEFGTAGYCVFARDVQPDAFIKGTLTWTDPPASPSSLISLVNNLDLQLIVDDIAYFGNALYGSSGYQQADFVNTVEQVDTKMFRIPVVEGKLYHFKVLGSNIPVSPQPYSMVVRGSGVKLQQTRCPDCVRAGDSQVCPITNGVGMQICGSDLFYSRCDVLTCNTDYTYNSGVSIVIFSFYFFPMLYMLIHFLDQRMCLHVVSQLRVRNRIRHMCYHGVDLRIIRLHCNSLPQTYYLHRGR